MTDRPMGEQQAQERISVTEQQRRYIREALDVWAEDEDATVYERDVLHGILAKLEPTKVSMAREHGRRLHVGRPNPRCLACRKFAAREAVVERPDEGA